VATFAEDAYVNANHASSSVRRDPALVEREMVGDKVTLDRPRTSSTTATPSVRAAYDGTTTRPNLPAT